MSGSHWLGANASAAPDAAASAPSPLSVDFWRGALVGVVATLIVWWPLFTGQPASVAYDPSSHACTLGPRAPGCTVDGCDLPHRARGLCFIQWKQRRATLQQLPEDSHVQDGALTVANIAEAANVTTFTVDNWQHLGRLPTPDGHALSRSWWWRTSLDPDVVRRRRRWRRTSD